MGKQMGNILAGIAIIVVGLLIGDSIFQGQMTMTGILFDGFGLFLVAKGVWGIVQEKRAGA
jgi:hypothetical protein